jgi:phosphoribosylanthranilate isomerase
MAPEAFARVRESAPWVKILKAYHVNGPGCLDDGERFVDRVDAFVLDTFNPATGQVGGTGVTHDWEISRRIAERYRCPIILSGGLSAENVAAAIEAVHPFGVDANTGTKGEDGFKDPEKMRAFVRATQ